MNIEFIEALKQLEKERGIDAETLFEAIEEALVSAYKREFDARTTENISAAIDRETGEMQVYLSKVVVDEVVDPQTEISLSDAKAMSDEFELGDEMEFLLNPKDFGRLAAQTAKTTINQKMVEAERQRIQDEFSNRIGELAAGVVQRKDRREVIVDIGRAEAILPYSEQSRLDGYHFNQRMKFYILKVDDKRGRPVVIISRSHPNVIRKLFEQEVPEISSGVVEIMSVSRDAGSRSKIAVASRDPNVDSVGSCVGQRGLRVQAIIDELNGEKIDIIEWDSDPQILIRNALSPAKVVNVFIKDEETRSALAIVPDQQLSLAIGREGQNVRLAVRLTGWKIDIQSESQYRSVLESQLLSRFDEAIAEDEAERAALAEDADPLTEEEIQLESSEFADPDPDDGELVDETVTEQA